MPNYNMYDLMAQMEKQKKDANKEIDDIFSAIDNRKNSTVDSVREKVNRMNPDSDLSGLNRRSSVSQSRTIRRPSLPRDVGEQNSRYDYFVAFVNSVDYGSTNNYEYVRGHKDALEKYARLAENNPDNLSLTEAAINDEIVTVGSISKSMYDKGYTDGLDYIYLSLKRSKEILTARIATLLSRGL